tara:strand:+ start:563 stop:1165 length:603 start_codon:yes stop_codon:yes gene_type:complete
MIDQLNGIIIDKYESYTTLMVGGIGFKINMSINALNTLPSQGEDIKIFTYLHVREDILELYGFYDLVERNVFHLLTSISGIGPKLALTILSGVEPEKLKDRIINGDVAALTKISGVGAKTAKRIIIELKEKFIKSQDMSLGINEVGSINSKIFIDTINALVSLGYKKNRATGICKELEEKGELKGDLELVIKKALQLLMS